MVVNFFLHENFFEFPVTFRPLFPLLHAMATEDKVLIIDDEPDSCILWKSFLTQLKYNVFTALTLRQGLELVESVRPDIIFLDNNLPDGLGWEKLDVIQAKIPNCRINLVSAYDFDPDKYIRPNVNVLRKPVTLSRIRTLLA